MIKRRDFLTTLAATSVFFFSAEIFSKTNSEYFTCDYVGEGITLSQYNSRSLLHLKINFDKKKNSVDKLLKSNPILQYPLRFNVKCMGFYTTTFDDLFVVLSVKDKIEEFKSLTVAAKVGKRIEKLIFI